MARAIEPTLLRSARRMCGPQDEECAQDLVQEAIVRGYEAYLDGRFADGTNARAWLLRIMTNLFITQHNRKKRWEAEGVDVDAMISADITPPALRASDADRPDRAVLANVLDEPLERAIAMLTGDYRSCIVLVDIEGLEYADAAAALGIPIGTLRTRLFRARAKLHAELYAYAREHGHVESCR